MPTQSGTVANHHHSSIGLQTMWRSMKHKCTKQAPSTGADQAQVENTAALLSPSKAVGEYLVTAPKPSAPPEKFIPSDGLTRGYYGNSLNDRFPLPVYDSHSEGLSRFIDLPTWFEEAKSVAIGEHYHFTPTDREDIRTLRALGFVQAGPHDFLKVVDLFATVELGYIRSDALPNVDAIAIISVSREKNGKHYVHATLRSLFAMLPSDLIVNVLVGSANTQYVSEDTLNAELGPVNAARVRVIKTPENVAQHFENERYSTHAKAAWNFARALRSYTGQTSIMVLEDDVEFVQNALINMRPWLKGMPAAAMLLSDGGEKPTSELWRHPASSLQVQLHPHAAELSFSHAAGAFVRSMHCLSRGRLYRVSRRPRVA